MFNPITTAGVYLNINGLFAFAFGPNQNEGELGIVRFGGHIEEGESIVECALREVKEETDLEVELIRSPVTFKADDQSTSLESVDVKMDIQPVLITRNNVMFFARSNMEPRLSSETKGIILLSELELVKLCSNEIKYGQFKSWGGRSIVKNDYDDDFILRPFAQMRFLARLIQEQPEILKKVYR
jgi:hypothetical protein